MLTYTFYENILRTAKFLEVLIERKIYSKNSTKEKRITDKFPVFFFGDEIFLTETNVRFYIFLLLSQKQNPAVLYFSLHFSKITLYIFSNSLVKYRVIQICDG